MMLDRRITRRRQFSGHLLAGAAAIAVAVTAPAIAQVALPTGGTVTIPAPVVPVNPVEWRYGVDAFNVGGVITAPVIPPGDPIPTILTVRIGSTATLIDWQSFSVGAGNTVEFLNNVGGVPFAVLNRVGNGATQSTINGILQGDGAQAAANRGSIWLVNPNGIMFGPNSSVTNVASFVASTLSVTDADFAAFYDATGPVTLAGASTQGITVSPGATINSAGVVLLVSGNLSQSGSITAGGDVGLVVAQDARVQLTPNSLMSIGIAAGTTVPGGQLLAAGTVNGQRIFAAAASQAAVGDILLN
ncbi:MAG: filamentous hemagglutinin N-terminal domain-containing protein, partial [Sandarakinorhabdus sp.]